jgi:cysteine desulfurase
MIPADERNSVQRTEKADNSVAYFDAAASSLPTEACKQALRAYDEQPWAGANPNSLHSFGRQAFSALEEARKTVARCLHAGRPSEVTFTSGGTESNNLAIAGIARAVLESSRGQRHRVLVSAIEHDSILKLKSQLKLDGIDLELVPVTAEGTVDLERFSRMLADEVSLVSVMLVNNELGTILPVKRVSELAHARGALVHTDAVQAFGKIPVDVRDLGVDAASVTAHKLGGPVGIGALYLRTRTPVKPIMFGGGQEAGLRSGTVDVRGAMALAAVMKDACDHLPERDAAARDRARIIVDGLTKGASPVARLAIGGDLDGRQIPETLCFLVPGHDSQSLIIALDDRGYEVSGGSSCSSRSPDPSHVLTALGIPRDEAFSELRVSFDFRTTQDQARGLVSAVREICA